MNLEASDNKDVGAHEVNPKDLPLTGTETYSSMPDPHGDGSPELPKRFNLWSTLGICFSITATPIGVTTFLAFSIGVGGSPVFIFGFIVSAIFNLCLCASLAEIAAVFPHASGQVYWAAALAPSKYIRSLSYWSGVFTSAAWFFFTAGTYLFTSSLVFALVEICHPEFTAVPYQIYLVYLASAVVSTSFNIHLIEFYPKYLKTLVVAINAGAIFLFVSLLARAHPKQSAREVFVTIINETGWKSNGVVFLLGLLPGVTAVQGFDSAAHMTAELPNPSVNVPRVMMGNAVISAVSAIPMIIAFMFCNVKPENLSAPVGGQPVAQLLWDAYDSLPLTIIAMIIYLWVFLSACISITTTSSRVWWSFGLESGLPCPSWIGRINAKSQVQVNALMFSFVINALVGLLGLGATTALNAMVGCAVICFNASYGIPIACLLVDKRQAFPQHRYFNLGVWGIILNWISLVWAIFVSVWLMFPLYLPATAASMNYAVAVFGVVVVIFGLNWIFYSRRHFTIPTITIKSVKPGA